MNEIFTEDCNASTYQVDELIMYILLKPNFVLIVYLGYFFLIKHKISDAQSININIRDLCVKMNKILQGIPPCIM